MKKVLFVRLQSSKIEGEISEPLDLLRLAAVAETCGCEAKIRDYYLGGNLIDDLREFSPQYLIASIMQPEHMKMVLEAKSFFPSVKVIVMGEIFSTYNINAIYENPFIDYIITCKAEFPLKEILIGKPDYEISGICYRDNLQGVMNEPSPVQIESMDIKPAYHLINRNIYTRKNIINKLKNIIKKKS